METVNVSIFLNQNSLPNIFLRGWFSQNNLQRTGTFPSRGTGVALPGPRKDIGAGERLAFGVLHDPRTSSQCPSGGTEFARLCGGENQKECNGDRVSAFGQGVCSTMHAQRNIVGGLLAIASFIPTGKEVRPPCFSAALKKARALRSTL